jgi:hypothetical protein
MKLENTIGARAVSPDEWSRYYITSTFHYNLPKWFFKNHNYREAVKFGLQVYYTDNRDMNNRLEISPYQTFFLEYPRFFVFTVNHHFQIEERFDMDAENWINTFGLRLSYKAKIISKFSASFLNLPYYFYIPVYIEFFWDLLKSKQFNDVRKLMLGLGYAFTPAVHASIHFGYNKTRNSIEEKFTTNDMVFRLRFHHYFNAPK